MRQVAEYKGKTAEIVKILDDESEGRYYQIVVDKRQLSVYPKELINIRTESGQTANQTKKAEVTKLPTASTKSAKESKDTVEALIWVNDPEIKAYQIASAVPGLGRVTAEKILGKREDDFDGAYPDLESIPLSNEKHRPYFSLEKIDSSDA